MTDPLKRKQALASRGKASKRAGPSQDLAVGGREFVIAVQRSRDDDPVNRIAMHVGQQAGLGSDPAGDGGVP